MNIETNAGALILSHIDQFTEAEKLLDNTIRPKIFEAIDKIIEDRCERNGWVGKFDFAGDDDDCWLAPPAWKLPDLEKPTCYAKFKIAKINDDNKGYWLSLLCGVDSTNGEAGFMFFVDTDQFGGVNKWKKLGASCDSNAAQELINLKFKKLIEWQHFLPVRLDPTQLALAWVNVDKTGDQSIPSKDVCFDPIRNALNKLEESIPFFDTIFRKYIPSAPVGKP